MKNNLLSSRCARQLLKMPRRLVGRDELGKLIVQTSGAKICFLTAGEMYYGVYSDILSRLPANYFIRKPIGNEGLVKRINEIIDDNKPVIIVKN